MCRAHMNKKQLSELITRIDSFPSLPEITEKAMGIVTARDISTEELIRTISLDLSLSAEILKAANSAFFGKTMGVDSLCGALKVLGANKMRTIISSKIVFNRFKHMSENKEALKKLWLHAFLCASAAKLMADDLELDSGSAFMAGLLHDIGKLIVFTESPRVFFELSKTDVAGLEACEREKNVFGVSHDELGMKLMQKWMFPESLLISAGFHHHPGKSPASQPLPLIVHVADQIAHIAENHDTTMPETSLCGSVLTSGIETMFDTAGKSWNNERINGYHVSLKKEKAALEAMITANP